MKQLFTSKTFVDIFCRWVCVIKDYEMLKELFVKRGSDLAGRPTDDMYMRLKLLYPEGNKGMGFLDRKTLRQEMKMDK